jgi:basic membrane protein A and related proteins
MKGKISILCLLLIMVFTFTGCGARDDKKHPAKTDTNQTYTDDSETEQSADGYELALVTDLGTIDDKSFNQGAWEGLKQYAEENSITYKYYQPAEATNSAYYQTIGLAIEGGAKLVVCPGYLFEEAVYDAQTAFPDVKFILLDGEPHNGDYTPVIKENTAPIKYAEEQAGFLAGYAAVKEGYTKIGFMGGNTVPPVIRFGYGFIQGADYAAKEMKIDAVDIMYHYTGDFNATPETQSMAASWYQNGTEVIFGCGGAVGNSVMSAADAAGKKVIGVDVDQSAESPTVITSAMKMLSVSVYDTITKFYNDEFPGGATSVLDASNNGIGLPMETSKFKTFTQADYDKMYEKLVAGEVTPVTDTDVDKAESVPSEIVKVTEVAE